MNVVERHLKLHRPKLTEYELESMADRLAADGFDEASRSYRNRIPQAAKENREAHAALDHLGTLATNVADITRELADETSGDITADHSTQRGSEIADWLVSQGWTPPTSMPALVVLETFDEVEVDHA